MDERKPFRRGQDDGPAGLDRAEWSVTEAKTPVPKKARQPAVWLIPAAAGAVLLLTVGILLVRRGTPPPIPPASSPASDQEVRPRLPPRPRRRSRGRMKTAFGTCRTAG